MKKKRKKILFVVTDSHYGGRQKYILDLIGNMNRISFDVAVCVGGSGIFYEKLATNNIPAFSVRMLGRRVTVIGDIIAFFSLGRILFREKPDILHLNSTKTGIMGGVLARVYNGFSFLKTFTFSNSIRIVFTAHGWAFTEERSALSRLLLRGIQWLTVVLSHITIAVSHDTKKHMSEALLVRQKITVVHNGIEKQILKHRQVARAKLFPDGVPDQSENALWIGTISDLHRNKGVSTTINAIAQLPKDSTTRIIFVVIGADRGERGHLERLIKSHSLQDQIFLVGNKDDARELLKAFDVFTLTSVKEGFPYVILEAATAGLPVVASAVGGIGEIISDMESGVLTQPHNSTEVSRAIDYIITNKKMRKELGLKLSDTVASNFSLEKMVTDTLHHYNS